MLNKSTWILPPPLIMDHCYSTGPCRTIGSRKVNSVINRSVHFSLEMGCYVLTVCNNVSVSVCSSCRSLACAAMLMYDYPLKTDMETVRHLCVCVNVALGTCMCFWVLPSCPDTFLMPYSNCDRDTYIQLCYVSRQTGSHIPALPGQTGCWTVDICIQ